MMSHLISFSFVMNLIFSHSSQVKIQIYPGDDYTLMYNLYPLLSGFVALPPIQLRPSSGTSAGDQQLDATVLDDLVARYVPTHIYVLVPKLSSNEASFSFTFIVFDLILQPQAKERTGNANAVSGAGRTELSKS